MCKNKDIIKLYFVLSSTVLLDVINGYWYINEKNEMIIPLIRMIFIFFFLKTLRKRVGKVYLPLMSMFLFILLPVFLRFFLVNTDTYLFLKEISYLSKILYFISLYTLLSELVKKKIISMNYLFSVIRINSVIMALSIIVPELLGLSRATYEGSNIGSIGFFISNNATNITIIILSYYLMYFVLTDIRKKEDIIILFLLFVTLTLQASKTSYVFALLEIIFLVSYSIFKLVKTQKIKKMTVFFFWLLITILIILLITSSEVINRMVDSISLNLNLLLERQRYLKNLNQNSVLETILSGRIGLASNVIEFWSNNVNVFFVFSGFGVSILPEGLISEIDFIDIFVRLGLIGILLTYGLSFYEMKSKLAKAKMSNNNYKFSVLGIIIILGYSFFAGHVFVDIMPITFLTITLSILSAEENIINEAKYSDNNSTISKKRRLL